MNYNIIIISVILLLTDTCGTFYSRSIKNYTRYGLEIINYENFSTDGSDTVTYIAPHGDFEISDYDAPDLGFFSYPPFTPDQTDSLVINFYQEGSDTIYHKVFKQYDTTLLFRCLTGSEPPTCVIEERHLEGAEVIVR